MSLHEAILSRTVTNEAGCWVYPTNSSDGYARVTVRSATTKSGYTTVRAHRVVYEALVGPIPAGLEIDHVKARGCVSTACCNPAHLEPVTGLENKRRAAPTACPQGHSYDAENTYINRLGHRLCRACHRSYKRAMRQREAG